MFPILGQIFDLLNNLPLICETCSGMMFLDFVLAFVHVSGAVHQRNNFSFSVRLGNTDAVGLP